MNYVTFRRSTHFFLVLSAKTAIGILIQEIRMVNGFFPFDKSDIKSKKIWGENTIHPTHEMNATKSLWSVAESGAL